MDEDAIDRAMMRFMAFAVAGMTAVSLYIIVHDFIGLSRKSIVINSLAGAALIAIVGVRSFLKSWS
jgi:hypothetical protein